MVSRVPLNEAHRLVCKHLGVRAALPKPEIAAIEEEYPDRLRSTKDIDDLMGRVVAALHETGELDETYVVFTSDNGYHLGQHPPEVSSPRRPACLRVLAADQYV